MNSLKLYLLTLTLLLSGCKEDFATLHFPDTVRSDPASGPQYTDTLAHEKYKKLIFDAVSARGIDPDAVVLERVKDQDKLILLRLADSSLSDDQRNTLRAVFDEVIQTRKASSRKPSLDLAEEKGDASEREQARTVDFILDIQPEIELTSKLAGIWGDGFQKMASAFKYGIGDEVKCQLSANLLPNPALRIAAYEPNLKTRENAFVTLLTITERPAKVSAHWRFQDPALMNAIHSGLVNVSPSTSITTRDNRRTWMVVDQIALEFGSIGQQTIHPGQLGRTDQSGMEALCAKKGEVLGRPFSFYLGDSLDRLSHVEYL